MKEAPPQLDISDVIDIRNLSKEELKKVPGEVWKFYCGVEGCSHYTKIIDYGLMSMWSPSVQGGIWVDISKGFFICGPHYRRYRHQMDKLPQKTGPWINHIQKTINHPDFPEK